MWTQLHQDALREAIDTTQQQILLTYPDYTKPFELQTDPSDYAIGGVLLQENSIIGIYSKKLLPAEQNYTTEEKEALAILKSCQHFHTYISGVTVNVKTDHKNLLVQRETLIKSRAERFKQLLAQYDLRLEYLPGKDNVLADYLSRHVHTAVNEQNASTKESVLLVDTQNNTALEKKNLNWAMKQFEALGHPGVRKFCETLKPVVSIPKLKETIMQHRLKCKLCQRYTQARTYLANKIPLGHLSTTEPMKHISSDIVGPYDVKNFLHKNATKSKFYILTITDRCTRWTEAFRVNTITVTQLIKHMITWIHAHGKPDTVLHDQGRQYVSKQFTQFLEQQGITQINTSPYNPTGNAISERINQEITFVLAHNQNTSIKNAIQIVNRRLQNTYHRSINATPFELVHGYHPLDESKEPINLTEKLQYIKDRVQRKNEEQNSYQNHTLKVGDLVTVKEQQTNKLDPKWSKKHTITEINPAGHTVTLKTPKGKTIQRNLHQIRLL
ncbi:uncharacterized protein NEMAJ01_0352 [Nematocida major]|uniref:uncharacterized protein n=1 Tax=Nematocida major TaxID=1912982 RepID=UPI00200726A0|nr:uncharacterized protein NEMAJ01_0352 [Nematocida major]KAH9385456.1 hypothetical protein NEMAJ01_0352 [Nematocida major]